VKPRTEHQPEPVVVSLVSLGCAKNTVDSECLLGNLARAGLVLAEDPADADVCLVNTCGFIHDAREEAADVLRELSELKQDGQLKAIVAMGCLVERAAEWPDFAEFLRHADRRISFADYPRLPDICRALAQGSTESRESAAPASSFMEFLNSPRLRIGGMHSAYLKLSEGCSNLCRFCSIPLIRGRQVSRPIEDILAESRTLVASGAREICLIAQDTTSYGKDLYGSFRLAELLRSLKDTGPDVWFRMMYAYPRYLSPEILETLASESHLCPYIDLPLQHIADPMLRTMGRGMNRAETIALLDQIAAKLPHSALRTTFIVGHPGETGAHFNELLDFVREGRFTHAGVFTYSPEPETPAARLADDVPPAEKNRRKNELMLAQLEVSRRWLASRVGRIEEVMLDGFVDKGAEVPPDVVAFGRTRLEAPEVDGVILLRGSELRKHALGTRLDAKIVESLDYDLIAET